MRWELQLDLDRAVLRRFDPLPYLSKSIMDMQGLYHYKEKIYTILAELISNAIDHGLLELDSGLKATPDGFGRYYMEREKRMAQDCPGWLRIHVGHEMDGDYGVLKASIEDSGNGFDQQRIASSLQNLENKSGRGIPLVQALSESIVYSNGGSKVEVTFRWRYPALDNQ